MYPAYASSKLCKFILPRLKVYFARQKVKLLPFISSVWILTLKFCYYFMRVLRGFAHDDKWWLFSFLHWSVPLHMFPKRTWVRAGKVALVAFVWHFSTMCFQMSPQCAYMKRCIVTLVAFVCLFSTVCYQMSPQCACMRGSIVTLVAFVWFYDIVSLFLQNFPVLQTKVIIFKIFFHCQCLLCFAQLAAPNWVKSMIEFCFNF